ncbi:hypothetical protein [Thorsellia anophelis]|uniref:Uncharacterized protein n=1 Tax=Thorsellia anophelis DSM 18579 TaxID=1123402 RepID=A0A1I0A758_9GAMM|nr:hypothetical protein [Thorsellia anophelis]SES89957.1 hypothetical protein SAMN02583745_00816 [Thorsellia anophelis DSM 18579]
MKSWGRISTHNLNKLVYYWNLIFHSKKSFKTLWLCIKAPLILSITFLFGCNTSKAQESGDYCIYADTTSKYYNPNKLTKNQLEECEIRIKKILEIQEIQTKIQKTRPLESNTQTTDSSIKTNLNVNNQPLFDIQEPTKAILSTNKKISQTSVRTVKESVKPIYHTDAGASVNSGNQTMIIVSKAGDHSDSIMQNVTTNTNQMTLAQNTKPATLEQNTKRQYTNPAETDGLTTLLNHQANSKAPASQEVPSIKLALSDAKAVSTSPINSATQAIDTYEQKNVVTNIQESETLLLMQQIKQNKLPNSTATASKSTTKAQGNTQSTTNANDSSTEPLNSDAQPIPTFEPLPTF